MGDWTFFSNHGHVLVCLAHDRRARLRDVATQVGITERAVQKIVKDLQESGYITISKQGRCNRYRINRRRSLRHGLESHCTVGKWLNLVVKPQAAAPAAAPAEPPPEPDVPAEEPPAKEVAPEAAPAPVAVEARPVVETRPRKKKTARKKKKSVPVDTRQQGSLF